MPAVGRCEVVIEGEKMEEVKEYKYLTTVICKHGEMESEIIGRVVKGRCVMGLLTRIMRGRKVSMEVKRDLRNSILLFTLMYGSETWDME